MTSVHFLAVAVLLCGVSAARAAKPVIVGAQDNIFGAGQSYAPGGGKVPTAIIPVTQVDQCVYITRVRGSHPCASKEGCITLDKKEKPEGPEATHYNDPDGVGAYPAVDENDGTSLISGITAPYAGWLTGVFIPPGGPSGPAPAALDFTQGQMTHFKTLAPLIDQSFFAGDGRVGHNKGGYQGFVVPAGAGALVLGITDACSNWRGPPGCYFDNHGKYVVHYKVSESACQ